MEVWSDGGRKDEFFIFILLSVHIEKRGNSLRYRLISGHGIRLSVLLKPTTAGNHDNDNDNHDNVWRGSCKQ